MSANPVYLSLTILVGVEHGFEEFFVSQCGGFQFIGVVHQDLEMLLLLKVHELLLLLESVEEVLLYVVKEVLHGAVEEVLLEALLFEEVLPEAVEEVLHDVNPCLPSSWNIQLQHMSFFLSMIDMPFFLLDTLPLSAGRFSCNMRLFLVSSVYSFSNFNTLFLPSPILLEDSMAKCIFS